MFGNSSFSQTDWNLFGSKILSFREDAEWRKNNNIKTIYEFDYLKSDTNKLHIINKYNFDTKGLIESYYQSPPNFYNDFKIEKPFKYTFFRKYNYTEVDSMLLQTITIYKRLEEGTFVPPTVEGDQTVVRWPELVLMVEGITVQRSSQGRRYQR